MNIPCVANLFLCVGVSIGALTCQPEVPSLPYVAAAVPFALPLGKVEGEVPGEGGQGTLVLASPLVSLCPACSQPASRPASRGETGLGAPLLCCCCCCFCFYLCFCCIFWHIAFHTSPYPFLSNNHHRLPIRPFVPPSSTTLCSIASHTILPSYPSLPSNLTIARIYTPSTCHSLRRRLSSLFSVNPLLPSFIPSSFSPSIPFAATLVDHSYHRHLLSQHNPTDYSLHNPTQRILLPTMASDNGSNGEPGTRPRRSSITQSTLSNLFQRGNTYSGGPSFPVAPPNPAASDRRRLSITTLGLSGTSPNSGVPFGMRRGSMSTNSDSIDESAIDDDEAVQGSAKTAPTTPFVRRMSFGGSAMRNYRPNGSPGNGNASPPQSGRRASAQRVPQAQPSGSATAASAPAPARRASSVLMSPSPLQASNTKFPRTSSDSPYSRTDQQGFNWSEQLRSRAESSVSGARPSFSFASTSPPRASVQHDRAKSVSDMPQPPVQASAAKAKPERPKPDAFQERILKGDFYMD